jgi:hypothetical protein
MTITAAEVRTIVKNNLAQEQIDHDAAESVAAWADAHAGKLLTERNKPEGWHIVRRAGMTHLQTEAYWRDVMGTKVGGPNVTLLVAWRETNVLIPNGATLREQMPAFFAAALRRNEARRALIADSAALRRTAALLNGVERALAAVKEGMPFDFPDRYALIRGAGLEEVKVGRLQL